MSIDTGIKEVCESELMELPRRSSYERHLIIKDSGDLFRLCRWAGEQGYSLFTMAATDERLRMDRTFKIYYVLSASKEDELVILEYLLENPQESAYPSIQEIFPNATPLENEVADMFGLMAQGDGFQIQQGLFLHTSVYPSDRYSLRRTKRLKDVREQVMSWQKPDRPTEAPSSSLPEGMFILPVGPIHAGIIEAGYFPFYLAGEVPEELPLRLGYKHRGIEKLFEALYTLENGWELAEKVSGDSSFAHSMAYCQAVESMTDAMLPEPVPSWRAFFLELERVCNHIGDVSALAHDMAFERPSSEISRLREALLQLNQRISGHRLLRGINRPGGIFILQAAGLENEGHIIQAVLDEFLERGKSLLENPDCRDRMKGIGVLTEIESNSATGLVARASGRIGHDSRLQHPRGAYTEQQIQEELKATIEDESKEYSTRSVPIYPHDLRGDVFARIAMRVAEVETSGKLMARFMEDILEIDPKQSLLAPIKTGLDEAPNMEIGIGCAEGWRGDIVYFVMKGAENTIFRCKVRDPSVFNWYVFPSAVVRKPHESSSERYMENILADFPLINKSFNLSYAGHDL